MGRHVHIEYPLYGYQIGHRMILLSNLNLSLGNQSTIIKGLTTTTRRNKNCPLNCYPSCRG